MVVLHKRGKARNIAECRFRSLQNVGCNRSSEATLASLCADAGGDEPLHRDTVRAYLDALERVFVVEDQPAWSARLRSRSRLRRAGKRHFVDPSLAVAALGAGPERLRRDLGFLGLLFDSLVVRDLRVNAGACDAEVYHYRDNAGLEVDAVLETAAGEWLAAEVKLGGDAAIHEAARSLLKLRDRVDSVAAGEPTKLIVVTAVGNYSHERRDGVAVVPIGALGP